MYGTGRRTRQSCQLAELTKFDTQLREIVVGDKQRRSDLGDLLWGVLTMVIWVVALGLTVWLVKVTFFG